MPVWILDEEHELELLTTVSTPEEIAAAVRDPRWIQSFAKNHHVDYDEIGPVAISTVFLGSGHFPFETLVRMHDDDEEEGSRDLEQPRYETWREAIDGHESLFAKYRRIRAN